MAKEFKTIDELVALLESRNLKTDGETASILRRESYYAIVNGYKDTFLDRSAMQSSAVDVYKEGTTFRQIYDLFLFDRALRGALFPYLVEAEAALTNAVVYSFCSRYPKADAYLDRANYTEWKDMLVPDGFKGSKARERDRRLNDLMRRLNGKLTLNDRTRPFIRHYLTSYGNVPLWVLQNDLTFGNIEHFYQLQKRGVQNDTCRMVSEFSGRGWRIGAKRLLRAFTILVGYRNICAHGDRLYCASVKGARCAEMIDTLALVFPDDKMNSLIESVGMATEEYAGRIDPAALNGMYSKPEDIPEEFK